MRERAGGCSGNDRAADRPSSPGRAQRADRAAADPGAGVRLCLLFLHPTSSCWRLARPRSSASAILTDLFDGRLARRYGLVSDFGKIWDPIADKALTGAAFIGLSILGELPWWVTIVILVREWGITILRWAIIKYGVMAANRGGKLKTVLQSIALHDVPALPACWLPLVQTMGLPCWFALGLAVMGAAFVLTVVTGVDVPAATPSGCAPPGVRRGDRGRRSTGAEASRMVAALDRARASRRWRPPSR